MHVLRGRGTTHVSSLIPLRLPPARARACGEPGTAPPATRCQVVFRALNGAGAARCGVPSVSHPYRQREPALAQRGPLRYGHRRSRRPAAATPAPARRLRPCAARRTDWPKNREPLVRSIARPLAPFLEPILRVPPADQRPHSPWRDRPSAWCPHSADGISGRAPAAAPPSALMRTRRRCDQRWAAYRVSP